MLRAVALAVALSVLAAACALNTQPPPAGTVPIQARVRNETTRPTEFAVTTGLGVVPGAVQPSVAAPGATTEVTFYVPSAGAWEIVINDASSFSSDRLARSIRDGCILGIVIAEDGQSIECASPVVR